MWRDEDNEIVQQDAAALMRLREMRRDDARMNKARQVFEKKLAEAQREAERHGKTLEGDPNFANWVLRRG